jgi:hypothetical protein
LSPFSPLINIGQGSWSGNPVFEEVFGIFAKIRSFLHDKRRFPSILLGFRQNYVIANAVFLPANGDFKGEIWNFKGVLTDFEVVFADSEGVLTDSEGVFHDFEGVFCVCHGKNAVCEVKSMQFLLRAGAKRGVIGRGMGIFGWD